MKLPIRLSLSGRDRRALRVGMTVLAPFVLLTLVIRPYVAAVQSGHHALVDERGLLARERQVVIAAPGEIRRLRDAEATLVNVTPRLFVGTEAVTASAELARYVSARVTEEGLELERAETETMLDSVAPTGVLRVSIRARGEIGSITAFLESMERGPKAVRVERLGIARANAEELGESDDLVLTATIAGLARVGVLPESLRIVNGGGVP